MKPFDPSLYLITDPAYGAMDLIDAVAAAIDGGVTLVQYRDKTATDRAMCETATRLAATCAPRGVPLIINDRVDIALAVGAAGVHLGIDDLPVHVARSLLGTDAIIGFSPETDEQIARAKSLGANYLGIGPVFGTATKRDAGAALGIEEFRRRARLSRCPAVAIGGIDPASASLCRAVGAAGVAVVSAILDANDPGAAAAAFPSTG